MVRRILFCDLSFLIFSHHFAIFPESSASEILVLLGEELIATCCTGIVERAFRSLGADLQEFLGALEGVHDVLKLQEDGQTDTDFICADEGELLFTSERPVIAWLLLGSLKALTRILYDIDASIVIEPIEGDTKCYRYLFTIPEQKTPTLDVRKDIEIELSKAKKDATTTAATTTAPGSVTPTATDLKMSPTTFCKAFPWHFIMNVELEIIQMGKGFSKLFKGSLPTHGRSAINYFNFKRPINLTINFREIKRRSNTPFVLSLKSHPGVKSAAEVCTPPAHNYTHPFEIVQFVKESVIWSLIMLSKFIEFLFKTRLK